MQCFAKLVSYLTGCDADPGTVPRILLYKLYKVFLVVVVIFYKVCNVRCLCKSINSLPAADLRMLAYELRRKIELQTGNSVEVILPTPVKLLTFINMSFRLPHIRNSFGG